MLLSESQSGDWGAVTGPSVRDEIDHHWLPEMRSRAAGAPLGSALVSALQAFAAVASQPRSDAKLRALTALQSVLSRAGAACEG
jgi:hypothetical protein